MYFDSHAHLNDDLLYPEADRVVADALAAGVEGIVCIGYDLPSSLRAVALAERHAGVYAAVGLHPENADRMGEDDFAGIERLIVHPRVVAIGEIGLDRYWDRTKVAVQSAVFVRQIALAARVRKPIVVHMREATQETLALIAAHKPAGLGGVMHCYGGSPEAADAFLALGMMISLAGPVTFKNARVTKEVALRVPLDRLLIETDSPYLSPEPFRGKRNEPKHVVHVAAAIAALRGLPVAAVAEATTANARTLFDIPLPR